MTLTSKQINIYEKIKRNQTYHDLTCVMFFVYMVEQINED